MAFHSQFHQDSFLEDTIFKHFKNGTFMDVGAHDGLTINNTLYFERENHWTGTNIEPIKEVYDKLIINRPKCININCAVSSKDGTAEFILNKGYTEMISGLKKEFDPRHMNRLKNELHYFGGSSEVVVVPTKRIETICNENNIKYINYLSIDVEGAEFEVIKSINFEKVFIDVIGFENNYEDVSVPIIDYLSSKGYILLQKSADIFMIHKNSMFKPK